MLGATSASNGSRQAMRRAIVDEPASVDRSIARVESEEWLRERCGAIVSCVAGIDGPGRNPVGWIRQGRIGHCHRFIPHHASDGVPRRWSGIMAVAAARWGAATPLPDTPLRASESVPGND